MYQERLPKHYKYPPPRVIGVASHKKDMIAQKLLIGACFLIWFAIFGISMGIFILIRFG